jgi:hypothetical protein
MRKVLPGMRLQNGHKRGLPRLLHRGFAGSKVLPGMRSEAVTGASFSLDMQKNVLYKHRARKGCEPLKGKKRRVLSREPVFT